MRDDLEKLLRDTTLITLALAIGLGWSLFNLARGIATFVDALTAHVPDSSLSGGGFNPYGGASWQVGHRYVTLDGILEGLVELAVVVAAAWLIQRHRPQHSK